MWKIFSYRRLLKRISYQELGKKWTLDDSLRKLRTTGSIERTVVTDFKMCWLYVVLVLQGSVETQLGWSGQFYLFLCTVFLPVCTVQKYKNPARNPGIIIKNKVARFYGSQCIAIVKKIINTTAEWTLDARGNTMPSSKSHYPYPFTLHWM